MITQQGIINKTIQGFFIDKKPAGWSTEEAACVYWNRDTGAVCAAGNLLSWSTLKALSAEDQSKSVGNLLVRLEKLGTCADDADMLAKHMSFISDLQREHDAAAASCLAPVGNGKEGMEDEVDQEKFRQRFWYSVRDLIKHKGLKATLLPTMEELG